MKYRLLLALAAIGFSFALASCSKSEADQKVAVEEFKKEAVSLEVWMKEKGRALMADPKSAKEAVAEIVAKIKAVKTENLPEDLKSAWSDFRVKFEQFTALTIELSADPMETAKKALIDPAFRQNSMAKVKTLTEEMKVAGERLQTAAKKYGIAAFDNLALK